MHILRTFCRRKYRPENNTAVSRKTRKRQRDERNTRKRAQQRAAAATSDTGTEAGHLEDDQEVRSTSLQGSSNTLLACGASESDTPLGSCDGEKHTARTCARRNATCAAPSGQAGVEAVQRALVALLQERLAPHAAAAGSQAESVEHLTASEGGFVLRPVHQGMHHANGVTPRSATVASSHFSAQQCAQAAAESACSSALVSRGSIAAYDSAGSEQVSDIEQRKSGSTELLERMRAKHGERWLPYDPHLRWATDVFAKPEARVFSAHFRHVKRYAL